MKKIREWMHGGGRIIVSAAAAVAVMLLIFDYSRGKDSIFASDEPNPTVSPKSAEEELIGGNRLEPASAAPEQEKGGAGALPSASPAASAVMETSSPESHAAAGEESSSQPSDITLGFAGDITLDDTSSVMCHMREKGGLEKVISPALIRKMNAYDAMIINNEFSVSKRGQKMEGKAYTFRSRPSNLRYLKQLGVDVAGLANNHIYDYGRDAFLDTLKYLRQAGFQTTGAGKDIKEARKPAFINSKGKTIAVVAATRAEKNIYTPGAGKNSPGVFRTYDDRQYVKEIKKAKKTADYVIAYVHWGTEYSTVLEQPQIEQAKDYINAGADAVVGAHTHCLQGIGYYKGVPIFYSLGNFWFNSKILYTTVVEMSIDSEGNLKAKMVPCLQKGMETRILKKESQKKKFIRYVNGISTNAMLDKKCNVAEKPDASQ